MKYGKLLRSGIILLRIRLENNLSALRILLAQILQKVKAEEAIKIIDVLSE